MFSFSFHHCARLRPLKAVRYPREQELQLAVGLSPISSGESTSIYPDIELGVMFNYAR